MVLLVEKLSRSLKFPYKLEHHHHNSEALTASLHNFRSKISIFLSQILLKPGKESEFLSLEWFPNCFDLINIINRAFAKLVVEINYPMSDWGGKATEEYLNYSLNLLDLLNSISSSVSHLNHAKISIFHALTLIENSPDSAEKHPMKIPRKHLEKDFKLKGPIGIQEIRACSEKESVIVEALTVLKKIGFLALGLVLSGLCSDCKPYLEIRKFVGGFEDSLVKTVDSRFSEEIIEIKGVIEEVNFAAERVSNGRIGEGVNKLKRRLEVMENSIERIEKLVNNLFSEVLVSRNKLLDNLRFIG